MENAQGDFPCVLGRPRQCSHIGFFFLTEKIRFHSFLEFQFVVSVTSSAGGESVGRKLSWLWATDSVNSGADPVTNSAWNRTVTCDSLSRTLHGTQGFWKCNPPCVTSLLEPSPVSTRIQSTLDWLQSPVCDPCHLPAPLHSMPASRSSWPPFLLLNVPTPFCPRTFADAVPYAWNAFPFPCA